MGQLCAATGRSMTEEPDDPGPGAWWLAPAIILCLLAYIAALAW